MVNICSIPLPTIQLRLWCIQIPLIGIPSMIVATEAIPNDLTAKILYAKSKEVINGLKSHGVNVVSYACDGTQVKCSIQDLLVACAASHISHSVPDPERVSNTRFRSQCTTSCQLL